jgi:hypothetical protein
MADMMKMKVAAIAAAAVALSTSALHAQTPAPAPAPKPAKQSAPRAKPPAKPPAQPQQAAPSTGKTLCVASALGGNFNIQTIGFTVFSNAVQTAPIDSWGLDDLAVRKTTSIVSGLYAVRRISMPPSTLTDFRRPLGGILFGNRTPGLDGAIQTLVASNPGCHFYMLLTRSFTRFESTNQNIEGIGLLNRENPLFERRWLHAIFTVRVIDGQTREVVRSEMGRLDVNQNSGMIGIYGASREVGKDWWPASPQAVTQSAQLRNATQALIEQALTVTLRNMFEPGAAAPSPVVERN